MADSSALRASQKPSAMPATAPMTKASTPSVSVISRCCQMVLPKQGSEMLSSRPISIASLQLTILAVPSANSVHTRRPTSPGVEKKNLGRK